MGEYGGASGDCDPEAGARGEESLPRRNAEEGMVRGWKALIER